MGGDGSGVVVITHHDVQAGVPSQGGVGGPSGPAAVQRRGFIALASYSMCYSLTLTDAARVMRRLAVNGTIPLMKNYEVRRGCDRATAIVCMGGA